MTVKNKPIIVLGLGPSGLFLTRQLHDLTSNIYGIGRGDDVGLYSRYISKEKRFVAETKESLLHALQRIKDAQAQKPLLYICSDQYLSLLLDAPEQWEHYFDLAGSGFNTLSQINDKPSFNTYCTCCGINVPTTVTLEQFFLARPFDFPVIVKWKEKRLNEASNPVGKVRICQSETDLLSLRSGLERANIPCSDLFIQQYIQGNNRWQYSVGGYFREGAAFAQVVVNQAKQYPQGISAQVFTVNDEYSSRLCDITNRLAQQLQFTGFLEAEFKLDEKTKEAYLLDVNPRPWGWVSVLGTAYSDFHLVLSGKHPSEPPRPVIWQSNLRRLLAKRNPHNAAIDGNVNGFARAYDIYDSNDKMPSLMIYIMAGKKILKRCFR